MNLINYETSSKQDTNINTNYSNIINQNVTVAPKFNFSFEESVVVKKINDHFDIFCNFILCIMLKSKINPYDQKLSRDKKNEKKLDEKRYDKRRITKLTVYDEIEIYI